MPRGVTALPCSRSNIGDTLGIARLRLKFMSTPRGITALPCSRSATTSSVEHPWLDHPRRQQDSLPMPQHTTSAMPHRCDGLLRPTSMLEPPKPGHKRDVVVAAAAPASPTFHQHQARSPDTSTTIFRMPLSSMTSSRNDAPEEVDNTKVSPSSNHTDLGFSPKLQT